MAKYQAREWTQADSDAFNKKRAEQLAKLGVYMMYVIKSVSNLEILLTKNH